MNTNNLLTFLWFQVFLSNVDNFQQIHLTHRMELKRILALRVLATWVTRHSSESQISNLTTRCSVCVCVCLCDNVRERMFERVRLCARERERERAKESVCERKWEGVWETVCEREFVYVLERVCVREKETVWERVCV